ncbi:MAG: hypothetical protein KDB88_09165 [Flavobacteriales bacterium]|nr:hypothetical protein [Flavobacteriales bacterium]
MSDDLFNTKTQTGLVFTGCLMLGLGSGMLLGRTAAGVMIGIGMGMLVLAFLRHRNRTDR